MRIILSGVAAIILALAWGGLLGAAAAGPFSAHMVVHVSLMSVAAPLLALAAAGGAADPTTRWPRLAAPIPLMLVELVVVWGWHVPALHLAARSSLPLLWAEQASFLGVGWLLWLSALGGGGPARQRRYAVGILALLMTSMHMTLLGVLITLSPRLLYAGAAGDGAAAALVDQQVAGLVMLVGGAASYLAGGLYLTWRLLEGRQASPPLRRASRAPLG